MHAINRFASGLAVLACICAAPPAWSQAENSNPRPRVRSLLELRHDKVVPQQWDVSCGAAALATVFTYEFGDRVSERAVAAAMLGQGDPAKVKKRGGFSLLDMKRFAEARGYRATGYGNMTLEALVAAAPAIVPLHAVSANHFIVFRGILDGDRVAISDPAWGNRTLSLKQFEATWVERVAFVVEKPGLPNPPNQLVVRATDRLLPTDRRRAEATAGIE